MKLKTARNFRITAFALCAAVATSAFCASAMEVLVRDFRTVKDGKCVLFNIGTAAHGPSSVAEVMRFLPDAKVTFWADAPLSEELASMMSRRFPQMEIVWGDLSKPNAALAAAVERADMLVVASSSGISGGVKRAARDFRRLHPEKRLGALAMGTPCEDMKNYDFAFFRDELAYARGREKGWLAPIHGYAPDSVFYLDTVDEKGAEAFMKAHGLVPGKFVCAIPGNRVTPRWEFWPDTKPNEKSIAQNEKFLESDHAPLRAAIAEAVRRHGVKVLICAEQRTELKLIKSAVYDNLPEDVKAGCVCQEKMWGADLALGVYRKSRLVFGIEMHSQVMALGSGIPAVLFHHPGFGTKADMWRTIGVPEWRVDLLRSDAKENAVEVVGEILANPSAAAAKTAKVKAFLDESTRVMFSKTLITASDELYRYWRQITGDSRAVPVKLRVDPKISKSGNDAYSIVTKGDVAVITGSNARSVLYGVYDLLERRGGCGWFWDGDRVPKKKSIDLSGLDVHEESKFAWRGIRYFAHRGLTRFQAEHWGFEEWKREIDWCLKKRLNLFMLRIGQDDIFQKAFPETCAYPDASKPLPGQGRRYDNRSLFWPLKFRGELRKKVMEYAFRRGMMAPSDFGTMTHWYSRTPQDFLDKMKPDFLPQAPGAYGEPSGLVWDIRDSKWMDAYWRITDADIREYGRPGLLHTIGIAERRVSTNRTENLIMKTKLTQDLLSEAKRRHPESTLLLAGWDLYCMKRPDEVKAFLKNIPEDVVIWDYEADASINTWFGEWDIVGKRPYVFGVFMAYEAGLDARTDYAKIAARQRLVADDPMCKGYILWPESSHVDSVGIEWFAKNAWRADTPDVEPVVADYCARRYPGEANLMADLWMKTIPVSTNMQNTWRWNAFLPILREMGDGQIMKTEHSRWPEAKPREFFANLSAVVKALKSLDWEKDEFLRRDMIDVARVWADRLAIDAENAMFCEYLKWLDGDAGAAKRFGELADVAYARLDALASLLALHTDFSVCDSYDRLAKVHPIAYPGFSSVLVDNIANYYCASHQAELARHCYLPAFRHFVGLLKAKMAAGDRTPVGKGALEEFKDRAMAMPIRALRLDVPRTREAFNRALDAVQSAAGL